MDKSKILWIIGIILVLTFSVSAFFYFSGPETSFGVTETFSNIFNGQLSSATIDDLTMSDMEGYKVERFDTAQGPVFLALPLVESCDIKPDGSNDGWKECEAELIVWNKRTAPISLEMLKDNFQLDLTEPIRAGSKSMVYSGQEYIYTETLTNQTCMQGYNDTYREENNISCEYDILRVGFNNWQVDDGSSPSLGAGKVAGIKIMFEIPQYQTAQYNLTYLPTNYLIDPTVSACGTLSTANAIYTLTQDIESNSSICFLVTANNITLDMGGYTLSSNNTPLIDGINVINTGDNFKLRNGFINNFDDGVATSSSAVNLTVTNMSFTESTRNIWLNDPSTGHNITNSEFYGGAYGIYFDDWDTSDSYIANNYFTEQTTYAIRGESDRTLYENNTVFNTSSIGINIFNSEGVIFKDNVINITGSRALYIQTVEDTFFENNKIYNPLSQGFYVVGSGNANITFKDNYVEGSGASSACYHLTGDDFLVYNNTAKLCAGEGIYIIGGSGSNVSENYIEDCSQSTATACIHLWEASNNLIDSNTIVGAADYMIQISSLGAGDLASNNVFMNMNVSEGTNRDIDIGDGSGSQSLNNTFINVTYLTEQVDSTNSSLLRKWWYKAQAVNATLDPLSGINITGEDNVLSLQFLKTTDVTGYITLTPVTEYLNNRTSVTYYNDWTINATNGTEIISHTFNFTTEQNKVDDIFIFGIPKNQSSCNLSFNPTSPITYGTQTNVSCACDNPEASPTLTRNGTDVTSEIDTLVTLGAGVWNYTCSVAETQNWTSASNSSDYTVNKATPTVSVSLSPSSIITLGQQSTATGNCPAQLTCNLFRNGTSVSNPDIQTLALGIYNYTTNTTGNQNYTSAQASSILTVQESTNPIGYRIENISVFAANPDAIDKDQVGRYGIIMFNPTDEDLNVTRVEVNASFGITNPFNGIDDGAGNSYPEAGWALDNDNVVYWTGTQTIPANSILSFYIRIDSMKEDETFAINYTATINGTRYQDQHSHTAQQANADIPFAELAFDNGTYPKYSYIINNSNSLFTFNVSLEEDGNKLEIPIGTNLTIYLPDTFTNATPLGGTNWNTGNVINNTIINTTTTAAIIDSRLTYGFQASAYNVHAGLYVLESRALGGLYTRPILEGGIKVLDVIPPVISIDYPLNTTYAVDVSELNYTATDETEGSSCWYSTDGGATNSTPSTFNVDFTGVTSIEGSNTWTVYCNDTSNNLNSDSITFFKDTIPPTITNLTNQNESGVVNGTIYIGDNVTINATVTDANGVSSVWINIWEGAIGVSSILFQGFLDFISGNLWSIDIPTNESFNLGENNYTIYANDTYNNTAEENGTFDLEDNVYPLFSNQDFNITNGTEYNMYTYLANVTIINTNGTAGIEFNGVNYTATNVSTLFESTLGELAVGVYPYYWWAYGSGLGNLYNTTQTYYYTIEKNSSYVLAISGTTPITYPTVTDVVGSGCPTQLTCALDKPNQVYGVGVETFNYSTSGNANYTASSTTTDITINQNVGACDVLFNETSPLTYPESFEVWTNCNSDFTLERDGTPIANNSVQSLSGGTYNFTVQRTDTANYSNVYDEELFTINQATTSLTLTLTPSSTVTYPTTTTATGTGCPSGVTCNLYRDGVLVSNPEVILLGVGTYNYTYNTTGNENYTADSESDILTVNQNAGACDVLFNETSPLEYPSDFQVWTNCNSPFTLLRNGGSIANNSVQDLGIGTYNFTVYRTDTINYSNIADTEFFTIQDTTPPTISNLTYQNESGVVNGTVILGHNVTINATVTDATAVDSVWIRIWEGAIGISSVIFEGFLNFISGDLWSINIPTNLSFNIGENNYTIYANDSGNNIGELNGTFTLAPPETVLNMSYPPYDINVIQNTWFNVTLNITCTGECGEVNVSLDPEQDLGYSGYNLVFANQTEGSATGARLETSRLYMDFNKPNESTYVQDNSIYNNFGVNNGATYNSTGGYLGGGAYEFDGNDDIAIAGLDFSDEEYTISSWIKTDYSPGASDFTNWFSKTSGTTSPFSVGMLDSGNNAGPQYVVWSGGTTLVNIFNSSVPLNDDTWHHVVATYKSGEQKLYVDNQLVGQASYSGALPSTAVDTQIGGYALGGSHSPWNGFVDEVQVYYRVLSSDEINDIYNSEGVKKYSSQGDFNSLVFYNQTSQFWNVTFNIADSDGDYESYNLCLADDNCVAYYPLDGNYEDIKSNYDMSCTTCPNNGTGISSPAMNFNASNYLINYSLFPVYNQSNGFTVGGWVYLNELKNWNEIIARGVPGPRTFELRDRGDRLEFITYNSSGNFYYTTYENALTADQWYFVAGGYNGTDNFLYVNGELVNTTKGPDFETEGLNYGYGFGTYMGSLGTNQQMLNGTLDEMFIYNKSATESEMYDLYKAGLSQHANTNITLQTRTADNYNLTDPSLISFWSFNNNNSYDELGINNLTAIKDITYDQISGVVGLGADSDGSGDMLQVSSNLSSNFSTIAMWVKRDATTPASYFWDARNGSTGYAYFITTGTEEISTNGVANIFIDGVQYPTSPKPILTTGEWHHVAFTTTTPTGKDSLLTIGGRFNLIDSSSWDGQIDEVKIFDTVLTQSEVQDLYELGTTHIEWSAWQDEGKINDGVEIESTTGGNFFQMKPTLNTNDTISSPYLLNHSLGFGELTPPPSVTKSGLISTIPGTIPFWTNESNPRTINLSRDESQEVVFWVNATGDIGTTHVFFGYANLTMYPSISAITQAINVTIIADVADITIVYPQNISYSTNVSELNYTYTGLPDNCWYSLDGGTTNTSMTCGNNITGLTSNEGSNTWSVYANNTAGIAEDSVTFYKDTTNPTLDLYVSSTTLEFGVDSVYSYCNVSDISGIDSFVYNITYPNSSLLYQDLTANASVTLTPTNLSVLGNYTFNCWANDTLGNYNQQQNISVVQDTLPPNITSIIDYNETGVINGTVERGDNFTINATVEDVGVGVDSVWVNIWQGAIGISAVIFEGFLDLVAGIWTIEVETNSTYPLGDLNYTVYANDTQGLESNESGIVTIQDTIAPNISIVYPTAITYPDNVTELNYTVSGSGIDTCWYTLDGGTTNTTITCGTNVTGITSVEGSNTWTVYVNDTANNINSDSVTFSVDTTAPIITIDSPTATTYNYTTIDLNVSANEPIDTWWYSLNGGSNTTFSPNTTITGVEGNNILIVYGNDSGGLEGSDSVIFEINTQPNTLLVTPQEDNYELTEDINISGECKYTNGTFCGPTIYCRLTSYYPNETLFFSNELMTQISPGIYNYVTNNTGITGYYSSAMVCYNGGLPTSASFSFSINEGGTPTPGALTTCRYKRYGYNNPKLPGMQQTGCI